MTNDKKDDKKDSTSNYIQHKTSDKEGRDLYGWSSVNKSVASSKQGMHANAPSSNHHEAYLVQREHTQKIPDDAIDVDARRCWCTIL